MSLWRASYHMTSRAGLPATFYERDHTRLDAHTGSVSLTFYGPTRGRLTSSIMLSGHLFNPLAKAEVNYVDENQRKNV